MRHAPFGALRARCGYTRKGPFDIGRSYWEHMDVPEHVPYGSAYGVDNLAAQEALHASAIVVLDEALATLGDLWHQSTVKCLAESHRDSEARRVFTHQSRIAADPFLVTSRLPDLYEGRYASLDFLKNWIVTLGAIGWKLAQPEPFPLTNVAEELAMHALIEDAIARVDDLEPSSPEAEASLRDLYDSAFEDNDFRVLFRSEDSEDLSNFDSQNLLGMTDLRFENWFRPFGSGVDRGVPHPFVLDA